MVTYKKIVLIATAALVLAGSYFYFTSTPSQDPKKAYTLFEQQEFHQLERLFDDKKAKFNPAERWLYIAYYLRDKGDLAGSKKALLRAGKLSPSKNTSLRQEILYNEALNAYLTHSKEELAKSVSALALLGSDNGWTLFFSGLLELENQKCKEALVHWTQETPKKFLSPWMTLVFTKEFPESWIRKTLAECHLNVGETKADRKVLEKGRGQIKNSSDEDQIEIGIALTLLKEGEKKPESFDTGFSYLQNVQDLKLRFPKESGLIFDLITKHIARLILTKDFTNIPTYLVFLEKSEATAELQALGAFLANYLDQLFETESIEKGAETTALISANIKQQELSDAAGAALEDLTFERLKEGKIDRVPLYYEAAIALASNRAEFQADFRKKSGKLILLSVPNDTNTLTKTTASLLFLKESQTDPSNYLPIYIDILERSHHLWSQRGEEEKTISLLKTIYELTPPQDRAKMRGEIAKAVDTITLRSQETDKTENLPELLEFAKSIHISTPALVSVGDIADHLEDAKYFLQKNDFLQAKRKVDLSLLIAPDNARAIKLAGQINYDLGNYKTAADYLAKIKEPSLSETERLAVSLILSGDGDAGEKLLNKVKQKKSLSTDALLHLGLGLTDSGTPKQGMVWLKKAEEPNGAILAAQAITYFEAGDYQNAIKTTKELSPSYTSLDPLQAILIRSYLALKQFQKAEETLENLPSLDHSGEDIPTPLVFYRYKDPSYNPYVAAAKYAFEVQKNPKRAIFYLTQITNPNPSIILLRAKTYLAAFQYEPALEDFFMVYEMASNDEQEIDALRGIVKTYLKAHRYFEAKETAQRLLQKKPDDIGGMIEFAKAEMGLHRFDLALKEYTKIHKTTLLKSDELPDFVYCLLQNRETDQAIEIISQELTEGKGTKLKDKLSLVRLLAETGQEGEILNLIPKIADIKALNGEESKSLLALLIALGSYPEAMGIVKEKESELTLSPEGLLLLSKLHVCLSDFPKARDYARAAFKLAPFDAEVILSMMYLENDLNTLSTLAKTEWEEKKQNPHELTYAYLYFQTAAKLGSLKAKTEQEIREAMDDAIHIAKKSPETPLFNFSYGQLALVLTDAKTAKTAFLKCLLLDPGYIAAIKYLSHIYNADEEFANSVKILNNALNLERSDPETWELLAVAQENLGNIYEAVVCRKFVLHYRPKDITSYIELARLYLRAENPEDARKILEKALTLEPNNIEVLKMLLTVLYEPSVETQRTNRIKLNEDRQEVLEKLMRVSPLDAKKLIQQLEAEFPQDKTHL